MTTGAAERRQIPPFAARSVSTLSLSTSPATSAFTRSPSRGGRSHRKVGGWELIAPPTSWGSAWRVVVLYDSEAPVPLGAARGRTVLWSSWAGRASCRELEPTFLSHAAVCGRRDDDTSVPWGGDDEDDPDMLLQSTAALATSPLHDGSGDGSSLEETPRSPAFRLSMQLSFWSRLAIWRSLCCTLRAARHLSAAALFRLNIVSSGRGALAGTR
jgi:hypothetical protein